VVVALLYLGASALVLNDSVQTGEATATPAQLVGSAVVAAALVVAAYVTGRRPAVITPGAVPSPWLVGAGAFLAMIAWVAIPPTRIGTALVVAVALSAIAVVWRLSHRGDWGQAHVLALAGGAVVAAGCFAFLTTPIGDVSQTEKYGHNVALLLLVAALSAWGARRARSGWT
jgi:hypothetical protein